MVLFYPLNMKYRRLTKEQLEELHPEFINFLATQKITAQEWQQIKQERPQVAEQELDVFSDLIWEGVLTQANYITNAAPTRLFLFKAHKDHMELILVKLEADQDLTTEEGMEWLRQHVDAPEVELFTAKKAYIKERNQELFAMIEQGAEISKGALFDAFEQLIRT